MKTQWYKDAVIYQIYPRSFCDSNGDGVGDIPGIISKIPYLKSIGIDAVWLSPCYASPNDDNGYDISDYREIMTEFGSMTDWENMISEFHNNDIRLIMDLVVNHTSDEHFWFTESRKSKDNPYRDYYIWRDGKGKNKTLLPNKWRSFFSGPAWEWDENTKQYYLHIFSKKQPDLNWDNPKVRREVEDICNFWLQKGVDGFRCDVITFISKPADLYKARSGDYVVGPNWKTYIKELSENSWERYDTLIVGEATGIDYDGAVEITKENEHLLDTLFNFDHTPKIPVCSYSQKSTNLRKFKNALFKWQNMPEDNWQSVFYENHDQPRSIPRYAPSGALREKSAKSLAVSLLFQRGTAYIYQGQELGMTNCPFKESEYRDIEAINQIKSVKKAPFGKLVLPFFLYFLNRYARDNARTPMQWSDEKNAGFTTGEPWLKINPNYKEINATEQEARDDSVLNFYRKILKIRKEHSDVVKNGKFLPIDEKNKNIIAYIRKTDDEGLLVICSLSPRKAKIKIPDSILKRSGEIVLKNSDNIPELKSTTAFEPCTCAVWKLR